MKLGLRETTLGTFLCGVLMIGCKADPPPPPLPTEDNADSATEGKPGADGRSSHMLPDYSEATMKRFRVELCAYGSQGLRLTRDAYLASLGGKEPAADNLPSFGEFPNGSDGKTSSSATPKAGATATPKAAATATPKGAATAAPSASPSAAPKVSASAAPSASPSAAPKASASAAPKAWGSDGVKVTQPATRTGYERLPFARFVSSCTAATRKEGGASPSEAIDAALAEFDRWASDLNRQIMAAQRHYSAKQYESDKFEKARAMHKDLVASFEKLDEKFAALDKAVLAWEATVGKPTEKLDKGGETAFDAMEKARALAGLVLSDKPEGEAIKAALAALLSAQGAVEALGRSDSKSPFPRELLARLRRLHGAGGRFAEGLDDPKKRANEAYLVTFELAGLVEGFHRALGQHLRTTGQTRAGAPLTSIRPKSEKLPGLRPDAARLKGPQGDRGLPRRGREERHE